MQPVASRLANDSLLYIYYSLYWLFMLQYLCLNVIWTVLYFLVFCSEATILVCQSVTLTFSGAIFQSKKLGFKPGSDSPKKSPLYPNVYGVEIFEHFRPRGAEDLSRIKASSRYPGWGRLNSTQVFSPPWSSKISTLNCTNIFTVCLMYMHSLFCNVVCIL